MGCLRCRPGLYFETAWTDAVIETLDFMSAALRPLTLSIYEPIEYLGEAADAGKYRSHVSDFLGRWMLGMHNA